MMTKPDFSSSSTSRSGASSAPSDATLDNQIAIQEAAIKTIPDHAKPSPEAGMAAMDKAMAKNDLIDMKNERAQRRNMKRKPSK